MTTENSIEILRQELWYIAESHEAATLDRPRDYLCGCFDTLRRTLTLLGDHDAFEYELRGI